MHSVDSQFAQCDRQIGQLPRFRGTYTCMYNVQYGANKTQRGMRCVVRKSTSCVHECHRHERISDRRNLCTESSSPVLLFWKEIFLSKLENEGVEAETFVKDVI